MSWNFEKAQGGIGKNKAFINMLHNLLVNYDPFSDDQGEFLYHFKQLEKEESLLFNAYKELGHETIVDLGYAKTKIKEAIFNFKRQEGEYPFLMIDRIVSSFKLNIKIYADEIKETLQYIYHKYQYEAAPGIIYHAKASDIERYFICKRINGKEKVNGVYRTYYRLYSPIDKISTDLKYMLN